MKSLSLALTLFSLTGALVALDLSGAHRVQSSNQEVAQSTKAVHASRAVASAVTNADQEQAEADDEADAEVINAFLVTPRLLAPVNSSPVAALRYD